MINRDEIEQKVAEFDIHTSNVQRDYVYGWLLAAIYSLPEAQDRLILKGGNCLRKAYFEQTRYSNDIDFSAPEGVTEESLAGWFSSASDIVQRKAGIIFEPNRMRIGPKTRADASKEIYEAKLYFKDFYGNSDTITISVRFDITAYDHIFLPVQTRSLIHPYSDAEDCQAQVRCMKLEEILASKLKCLLQRRHSADLYDYVHWLMFGSPSEVSRSEILATVLRMTIFERSPGSLRGLLLDLPLAVLKGYWERYIVAPRPALVAFDDAVARFTQHIAELFAGYAHPSHSSAFFSSRFRNPIMEAASDLRLLRMRYDGVDRVVEPYALVYKKRKDGEAKEYFYAWDRTGGKKSGPGIKSLVQTGIQAIEVMPEHFEPRFQVELVKAGEPASRTYFGNKFGRPRTFTIVVHRPYVVECPYCGRRFRRSKHNPKLASHKSGYGSPCPGRTGLCYMI